MTLAPTDSPGINRFDFPCNLSRVGIGVGHAEYGFAEAIIRRLKGKPPKEGLLLQKMIAPKRL
ncbi:MAG TPA: hypothetical protein VF637_03295 [Sphingomicrobium sp.]